MKRMKRQKVKTEKPEASTSGLGDKEEHDLAYYIHDRMELMHQVFSVLKYKEIKAMAPNCVRNLAVGDLQELCTEELLGISSKRLLAILDGAEPPSDTESSSPSPLPDFETISLDSISSDEEILSQSSGKKKKHKHRRRKKESKKSKSKEREHDKRGERKRKRSESQQESRAERAGLTVLELLELQARARAIRAQLQNDLPHNRPSDSEPVIGSDPSDGEVVIKEEPHDVVEIISSDEDATQPKTEVKEKSSSQKQAETSVEPTHTDKQSPTQTHTAVASVHTKLIKDLIITVPQSKNTRKIKLNRNKPNSTETTTNVATEERNITVMVENTDTSNINTAEKGTKDKKPSDGEKTKKKKVKRKKKKNESKDSDNDEIMLQLSDTEKMDLLEDLEEPKDNPSTDSSTDSDDSSDSDNNKATVKDKDSTETQTNFKQLQKDLIATNDKITEINKNIQLIQKNREIDKNKELQEKTIEIDGNTSKGDEQIGKSLENNTTIDTVEPNQLSTGECITNKDIPEPEPEVNDETKENNSKTDEHLEKVKDSDNVIEITNIEDIPTQEESQKDQANETHIDPKLTEQVEKPNTSKESNENNEIKSSQKSDGEVSDRESSEIEAVDLKPEVVTISDEETKAKKKKKKKDKKSKKEKRKKDFRESSDENFYKDVGGKDTQKSNIKDIKKIDIVELSDEIYELSDESSCYEVEGTVLSKEPTADEIAALSAKIDEIERREVVTDEEIRQHEALLARKANEDDETAINYGKTAENDLEIVEIDRNTIENQNSTQSDEKSAKETAENVLKTAESDNSDAEVYVSWKDRYLDSKKVKRVLTTSNIINALRKKNIQLKKKIQESKKVEVEKKVEQEIVETEKCAEVDPPEGSIDHYNTLQGSSRYVDPVEEKMNQNEQERDQNDLEQAQNTQENVLVTKEMKKDAKQLLKMYKKLLKYNDMNRRSDPNRKKKKKLKKKSQKLIEIIKFQN